MKMIIMLFLLPILCESAYSQSFNIKGQVNIDAGEYYWVSILAATDSSLIGFSHFDTPHFKIKEIKSGDIIIQITSPMIFEPVIKNLIIPKDDVSQIDLGVFEIKRTIYNLNDVVIKSNRPQYKLENNKYIFDIQNNTELQSLGSLNEILGRLPLISISNDKISLFGKRNVIALVNGIEPKTDIFENLPIENIKDIEIILNPSSQYSAGGSAVINIITKKNLKQGFAGNIYTSISKGEYWRTNDIVQLNCFTSKVGIYGNFQISPNKMLYEDSYERYYDSGIKMINVLEQKQMNTNLYRATWGLDYFISNRHTIGFQYQNYNKDIKKHTDNNNLVDFITEYNNYNTYTDNKTDNKRSIYDFSYTFNIDSTLKKLDVAIGVLDYESNSKSDIEEMTVNKYNKESLSDSKVNFITGNIDYAHQLDAHSSFQTGLYYSENKSENGTLFFENSSSIPNNAFSNHIKIKENKFSGYVLFSTMFRKFNFVAGIRYEYLKYRNINMENKLSNRIYSDFFPSFDISYEISSSFETNFSYNRKIDRPKYQNLDPAIIYIDTLSYFQGNMFLLPEYSNNISLNLIYKKYINLSFDYSRTDSPISMYIKKLNPNSYINVATTENLKSNDKFSIYFTLPYEYKFWQIYNVFGYMFNNNKYYIDSNEIITNKRSFYFQTNHTLKFNKIANLSFNYQYSSAGIDGIFSYKEMHIFNINLSKRFMKEKLIVSLYFNDIFKGNRQYTSTVLNDMRINYNSKYDASNAMLSFRYLFGSNKNNYKVKNTNKSELERIN